MKNELTIIMNGIGEIVYYAKCFNQSKDVEVQLDRILEILNITEPKQVGLSKSVLNKMK